jgi:hypothetical protein
MAITAKVVNRFWRTRQGLVKTSQDDSLKQLFSRGSMLRYVVLSCTMLRLSCLNLDFLD